MTDPDTAPVHYDPPDLEPQRGRFTHRFGGQSIYAEPDPITVALLWRSHGAAVAMERWHWKTRTELSLIRQIGEERLAKRARTSVSHSTAAN